MAWYWFSLPRELFDEPCSTVVTDRGGELLGARISDDGQWRFPQTDSVSYKFEKCLLLFEDRWFRYHPGVNPVSLGRAAVQNLRAGHTVSGGSTISMQVIRLSRRGKRRNVYEKCIEAILATRLELRYSKDEILAMYASAAPYGGNVVGIDAASWRYWGHSPHSLSWAEAATLAILPNSPSMIHPSRGREKLKTKRDRLLKRVLDEGTIDYATYSQAVDEPMPGEPLPLPRTAPHLVDYFHKTQRGRRIRSTVDAPLQQHLEILLETCNGEFIRRGINNLAAVVIDVPSGEVVAYCGNVGYVSGHSSGQVDIIRAPRSSGSILKPLLYCAMMQNGEILPRTLIGDVPVNYEGFAPQNFNHTFDGAVAASEAVARSLNVPAVNMLRMHGVPRFHAFLRSAGITTLSKPASHYGLSLILGGAETTLWDVSSAYCNMARTLSGEDFTRLSLITGEKPVPPSRNPFDRGAVWLTFEAIKEVNRPEEIDWRTILSMQHVAWKTGTSYGLRDAWAVGATPRYVVGVWAGNSDGEASPSLTGATSAGPVMFDIFNILPSSQWFAPPYDDMAQAEVCKLSGHLRGRFCNEYDSVMVCHPGMRTAACPYHIGVTLSPDGKYRVTEQSAGDEGFVRKGWFVLPPRWEWYYRQHHPGYTPLPAWRGTGDEQQRPMQFIYPQHGAVLTVPRRIDGTVGGVTFKIAHRSLDAVVYWHLDGEYLAATSDFHEITISPSAGSHTLAAVDDSGNTISVTFSVKP